MSRCGPRFNVATDVFLGFVPKNTGLCTEFAILFAMKTYKGVFQESPPLVNPFGSYFFSHRFVLQTTFFGGVHAA